MHTIGTFAGATISTYWRENDGQQVIVITAPLELVRTPAWAAVRGLIDALSAGVYSSDSLHGDDIHVEIAHTNEVDARIVPLVDLLISIRDHHPTLMQLPLALSPQEALELTEVLP